MKIAFYHELHKGGARRGTNEFALQLKKLGHQVDLYTIDNLIKEEKFFYSNISSFYFKRKIWEGTNWKTRLYKDTIELLKLFLLNKKIASIINKRQYDLCYVTASQFIETPFILNFLKAPKAFYLNDPYYRLIYEPNLFHPLRKDVLRLTYEKINRKIRKFLDLYNSKKIDLVLACSVFAEKQFRKIYKKKGIIAYYGVDTKFFFPKNIKKDIDILYIGSKDVSDGYPLFKNITKKLSNKFTIREVLVENEWLTDVQIRELYLRTKIYIATSYNEPLGLTPLEAMACGAVVLAVDEAGHKETVINNFNGYLLKRNPDEFVNKIKLLLKNNQQFEKLSKNAINTVKNWTWEKRGKELEETINNYLNGI